jgi:hypothetical protein
MAVFNLQSSGLVLHEHYQDLSGRMSEEVLFVRVPSLSRCEI